ncbi:response regulator transcription factor [Bacillus badius]|uniref:Two-component response regulator n=1 Tax=Bacillus badius TaxID=1455 RepID=A0ABR5AR44_BACBA|nr:response regulator transcription factor [Bacillus badius]KIL73800.1 Two-component response regulator [Bacillus badius]KIL77215.1 Two-component response regulator [Bacillus badius]KZO01062.1 DNA-binding response regulator [Bacillus badius]MED0667999.1 response regulator transcription factor [Bacillus badius]MED4717579.1 response regulator transcription factor [Bacillus badius]
MQSARLLIVDDEQAILHMLTMILNKEGFAAIDTATTAEQALSLCQSREYDLILLDVMLPNQSGFDICPFIRARTDAPIFFLTARSSDLDKLSGFAVGADDYITKPFNPLEVVARIKAHLRRQTIKPAAKTIYQFGTLAVNTNTGEVSVNQQLTELPAQVYQLLVFFCQHPNQLFSKSQLYEQVWGEPCLNEDNTVMVHIRKLREKIEDNPSQPQRIVTVRGLGYKFVPAGEA